MSISEFKLLSEMAGAPIFSSVGPKSNSPMEIGNGTLRKSAEKRHPFYRGEGCTSRFWRTLKKAP
jgi:hypothetical protein